MLQTILRDLRFALRMLRKSPGFTIVAVLVITLGTGAVSTIFSAANAILLRALPGVAHASELVEVGRVLGDGSGAPAWVSYPYYRHVRDGLGARPVVNVAAWAMMPLTISTGREGVAAQGTIVSGNYFGVLAMRPALGRFFVPDEDGARGAHPVVVVSHDFWTTRLAGDSGAIGRTVRLNGQAFTLVGVAPPRFHGVYAPLRTDAWVPLAMQPQIRPGSDLLTDPGPGWLQLVARVPAGVDGAVVQRELSRLTAQYVAAGNEPGDGRRYTAVRVSPLSGLPSDLHGRVLGFMALLLAASGLVLLIASVNIAAMSLARAVARRRETAIRLALGASRGRLVQQLLTESVLLSVVGAAGGVLVAVHATRLLAHVPMPANTPFALGDLTPDARVLVFTLVVSLATGVAVGLVPALQSARVDLSARLRNDTARAGARRSTAQRALVAGQMAVSLLLLVTAGLFLRALDRGRRVDLGFDMSNVAVASFDARTYGYDDARVQRLYRTVKEAMARTPGVVGVSLTHDLPLGMPNSDDVRIDGSAVPPPSARGTPVRFGEVDAGYFEVLKLPIVEGRGFTAADDERAPPVAVVNQAFARRFWPRGAVGRTFRRGGAVVTVVGVARNATYTRIGEVLQPFVYFAIEQGAAPAAHAELLVRTRGDPTRLAPAIRGAVRDFDPLVPAPAVTTLSVATGGVLLPQRVAALVTAVLGVVGLLLAAVGLYGVVAYAIGQRTREIGVRLALGAERRDVVWLAVGEGMRPVAVGMAIGLVLAVGATRLLMSFLLGVSPLDAVTFVGGAGLLTAVALMASYLPARRAAAVDPLVALRQE